ncbi:hypothetical protein D3C77_498370 [compost metagenome]
MAAPGRPSPGRHDRVARPVSQECRVQPGTRGWRRQCAPSWPGRLPPGGCLPAGLRAAPGRLRPGASRAGRQSCRSGVAVHRARDRPPGNRQWPVPGGDGRRLQGRRRGSGPPAHCSVTRLRRGPGAAPRQCAALARRRRCPPGWGARRGCCARTGGCRRRFPGCRCAALPPTGSAGDGGRWRKSCRFPARPGTG